MKSRAIALSAVLVVASACNAATERSIASDMADPPTTYKATQLGSAGISPLEIPDVQVSFDAVPCSEADAVLQANLPTGGSGSCFIEIGLDARGNKVDPATEPVRSAGSVVGAEVSHSEKATLQEIIARSQFVLSCTAQVKGSTWEPLEEGVHASSDGGTVLGVDIDGTVVTVAHIAERVWKGYWLDGKTSDDRPLFCALFASSQDAVTSTLHDSVHVGLNR